MIAYLNRDNALPKAVFLDLKLPRAGGFDVLQWLRSRRDKTIPVLVTSGGDQLRDVGKAYALGAHAFLPKPYQVEDVRNLLAELPALRALPPRS